LKCLHFPFNWLEQLLINVQANAMSVRLASFHINSSHLNAFSYACDSKLTISLLPFVFALEHYNRMNLLKNPFKSSRTEYFSQDKVIRFDNNKEQLPHKKNLQFILHSALRFLHQDCALNIELGVVWNEPTQFLCSSYAKHFHFKSLIFFVSEYFECYYSVYTPPV